MDKKLLSEYMDACAIVKETEQEIQRLKTRRNRTAGGVVAGSNPDFPGQPQHFHISGLMYGYEADRNLHRQEQILEERKKQANEIKIRTEAWMNTIPVRMQRIIQYKIFENLSWEEVAKKMGRKATGNSLRMELERFLKEK